MPAALRLRLRLLASRDSTIILAKPNATTRRDTLTDGAFYTTQVVKVDLSTFKKH